MSAAALNTPWPFADPSRRVVVFCYHSVRPDGGPATVSPASFRDQVSWFSDNCEIIRFEDVLDRASATDQHVPMVAITFDDGYADNHQHALPVLTDLGAHATFFLSPGLIERDPEALARFRRFERFYGELRPLTWGQVDDMRSAGMDFGSHTWSHPNLARSDDGTVLDELTRSREILEERLGLPVTALAYPFGKPRVNFTTHTRELAARAGYERAGAVLFRGVARTDHPLSIPRFPGIEDDLGSLEMKVRGRRDLHGLLQERTPLWFARRIAPHDFRI